jgi:hypothetical protein
VPRARLRQQQGAVIESRAAGGLVYRGIGGQPPVGTYAYTNRGDPLLLQALRDRRIGEYPDPGGVLSGNRLLMPVPEIGIPALEA